MTSEEVRSELEKQPFTPLRLHLVSGKTVEVTTTGMAWMLKNAVFVLHDLKDENQGYDVIGLRNIERLERLAIETDEQ